MINEEVTKEAMESTRQGVTLAIKISRELNNLEKAAKEQMEVYLGKVEKGVQSNQVKLKDLYKKGQLENVEVDKVNLKGLKKELNNSSTERHLQIYFARWRFCLQDQGSV